MPCSPIPRCGGIWKQKIDLAAGKTYLTGMTAQTRLSAKGQVVIPKDVRDRLGLVEGTVFDVVETGDGVILRRPSERATISVEEAVRQLKKIYQHKGPPIPIERLSWSAGIDDPDLDRQIED